MKKFVICLLSLFPLLLAQGMPEFPENRVNDYESLRAWFDDAPHTLAEFEMTRTMPSGRKLKSRGTFEFRRGVGMMWRTEFPVRNAMVISSEWLTNYDARGRVIRQLSVSGAPSSRFTGAFMQELKPEFIRQMERTFTMTSRSNAQADTLVLGLKSKHESSDLRWLLLVVKNCTLEQVFYESARQGRTHVVFRNVRHSQMIPEQGFKLIP